MGLFKCQPGAQRSAASIMLDVLRAQSVEAQLRRAERLVAAAFYLQGRVDQADGMPFDPEHADLLDGVMASHGLPGGGWQLLGREQE